MDVLHKVFGSKKPQTELCTDPDSHRRGHRLDLDIAHPGLPRNTRSSGMKDVLTLSVQRWRSQVLHPTFWDEGLLDTDHHGVGAE